MTTDITELAQSLKAAANTTADVIDRLKAFPGDELIDLSQHEGEQVDIDITTLNEWYELSSPANIRTLVEALEKAQQRITQMESRAVTINTPAARDEDYDWDGQTPSEAFNTCRMICALMFRQSLRAAGIKVEAE